MESGSLPFFLSGYHCLLLTGVKRTLKSAVSYLFFTGSSKISVYGIYLYPPVTLNQLNNIETLKV